MYTSLNLHYLNIKAIIIRMYVHTINQRILVYISGTFSSTKSLYLPVNSLTTRRLYPPTSPGKVSPERKARADRSQCKLSPAS